MSEWHHFYKHNNYYAKLYNSAVATVQPIDFFCKFEINLIFEKNPLKFQGEYLLPLVAFFKSPGIFYDWSPLQNGILVNTDQSRGYFHTVIIWD